MPRGERIEPKIIEAAEKAYAEAPNADPRMTEFLAMQVQRLVHRDDYEPAAEIGKLLMDNNCPQEAGCPPLPGLDGACARRQQDQEEELRGRSGRLCAGRL